MGSKNNPGEWDCYHNALPDDDQQKCGERVQNFVVRAECIETVLKLADCISQGMRTNPMVWRAPITAIVIGREFDRRTLATQPIIATSEEIAASEP